MCSGLVTLLFVFLFCFVLFFFFFVFFFKQKTAYEIVDCDWSSDVCSSDLVCKVNVAAKLFDLRICRIGVC